MARRPKQPGLPVGDRGRGGKRGRLRQGGARRRPRRRQQPDRAEPHGDAQRARRVGLRRRQTDAHHRHPDAPPGARPNPRGLGPGAFVRARRHQRCRRRLRRQERPLSRAGAGGVGGAAAGATRHVVGPARRGISQRSPRPRQRDPRRVGVRRGGAHPGIPRQDACRPRRLRDDPGHGLADHRHDHGVEHLRGAGDPCRGARRLHQHGADRRLPRRRAPRDNLSHRAPHRRRRPRPRYRPRRAAAPQLHPAGRLPLRLAHRHHLRFVRLRGRHGRRPRRDRLE